MNTAIIADTGTYSGVGFAIPSDDIVRIIPKLIRNGNYTHTWLGIAGGKMTPEISESAGLPKNYKRVMVVAVQASSPADKVGLRGFNQNNNFTRIGNIIRAIDGHSVKQMDEIINYLEAHKSVGENIKLTVNRNAQTVDIAITLPARQSIYSQSQPSEGTP
ncbi:MAG: PDZ domain-containing protein [Nitrososphaeraceae archaeon]